MVWRSLKHTKEHIKDHRGEALLPACRSSQSLTFAV